MNPQTSWIRRYSALCLALLIFGAGYLPLLLFWQYGHHTKDLPGFFSYESATWGDGLCLPILALSLTSLIKATPKVMTIYPTILAATIGAMVGLIVILAWLLDPSPVRNWTLPRPHHLDIAGEWHAGFLALASGIFAALWIECLRRLRRADLGTARHCIRSLPAAGVVAGTLGYAWLAVRDAETTAHGTAGRASMFALTLAAIVLFGALLWATHGIRADYLYTLATGALLAGCVVLYATEAHPAALLYCAIVGAATAGMSLAMTSAPTIHLTSEALSVPAIFVLCTLVVVVSDIDVRAAVAMPLVALCVSVFARVLSPSAKGKSSWRSLEYFAAAGISTSLLAADIFGLWLQERDQHYYITGGFILTIVGAVLGGVFLPAFKSDFEYLMRVEGDPSKRRDQGLPGDEQNTAARRAWPRLVSYAVSSVTSMLVLTIALGPSLGLRVGNASLHWTGILLGTALVAIALVPPFRAVPRAWRQNPKVDCSMSPYPTWGGRAFCFVAAVLTCFVFHRSFFTEYIHYWLALGQSILITLFAVESVLANAIWLNLGRVSVGSRVTVVAVFLSVFTTVHWSLTAGMLPAGGAAPGTALLAGLIAIVTSSVLCLVAASVLYAESGMPYMTDYPPARNVAQDLFHLIILWFILGWLPQFVLVSVPPASRERWSAIGTILAGFLLLFGPAFLWILENNDTHVERQRRIRGVPAQESLGILSRASTSTDRIRTLPTRIRAFFESVFSQPSIGTEPARKQLFMIRLSGHTAIQNGLALVLATLSVVGIIGISNGLSKSATGTEALEGR